MLIKNLTLGLGIVLAGTALAKDQTYKIRNGDCDWTIARKFNTSLAKLHQANPSVRNWDALQDGHSLRIPSSIEPLKIVGKVSEGSAHTVSRASGIQTRPFRVGKDSNDWLIAHHLGVSLHLLHVVNPNVNWARLQTNQKIVVPVGESAKSRVATKSSSPSSSIKSKIKVNRIRSRYAVINTNGVSIRREAGQHAERITTVDTGTHVVVLDRDGAWYQLRFPRGTEGWVRGDYLNASHAPAHSRRRSSSEERVASRSRHRTHSYSHRYRSTEVAYNLEGDAKANPFVSTGMGMRGTRYSYGSSSRSATDCSGFTWQVYGKNGVRLPRTSREQSHVGQAVSKDHLKPGDLVFFSTRGSRGVGHVGMSIGGNKFVHASSGGGKVQVSSLNDPYYANHYKGARRIVTYHKKKAAPKHESAHAASEQSSGGGTNPTPITK